MKAINPLKGLHKAITVNNAEHGPSKVRVDPETRFAWVDRKRVGKSLQVSLELKKAKLAPDTTLIFEHGDKTYQVPIKGGVPVHKAFPALTQLAKKISKHEGSDFKVTVKKQGDRKAVLTITPRQIAQRKSQALKSPTHKEGTGRKRPSSHIEAKRRIDSHALLDIDVTSGNPATAFFTLGIQKRRTEGEVTLNLNKVDYSATLVDGSVPYTLAKLTNDLSQEIDNEGALQNKVIPLGGNHNSVEALMYVRTAKSDIRFPRIGRVESNNDSLRAENLGKDLHVLRFFGQRTFNESSSATFELDGKPQTVEVRKPDGVEAKDMAEAAVASLQPPYKGRILKHGGPDEALVEILKVWPRFKVEGGIGVTVSNQSHRITISAEAYSKGPITITNHGKIVAASDAQDPHRLINDLSVALSHLFTPFQFRGTTFTPKNGSVQLTFAPAPPEEDWRDGGWDAI